MATSPRIIFYAGKGGVGKTTVSTATGLRCARQGKRTIVLSLDMAHSLTDSFDLHEELHNINKGNPLKVTDNLWIQEIDVQEEIERNWGDVYKYFSKLLTKAGIDDSVADELAIIPGMEDMVLLLYINKYVKEGDYDVIILDCAPTGESLRFICMPSTLNWYMKKVFSIEKKIARVIRPLARVVSDVPIPDENYFKAIQKVYQKLKDIDIILANREKVSVRLVTIAEKMVVRETQRAFMYFSLFGMVVDTVIVNRRILSGLESDFLKNWADLQNGYMVKIKESFAPAPVKSIPLFEKEIIGLNQLDRLGQELFRDCDPCDFFYKEPPYHFISKNGNSRIEIRLPGVQKKDIDLMKSDEELIVKVGTLKRHVMLPRAFARKEPSGAKFEGEKLCINFE